MLPPQIGGSGRWLWELYRRLPLDIKIVAGNSAGAAAFDQSHSLDLDRISLQFSSWGVLSRKSLAEYGRAFTHLSGVIRSRRPQVLHCGKSLPEGLLARACALRFGVPYVCYVHGEELTLTGTSRELRALTRHVLRHAKSLIANSENTRGILVEHWSIPAARIQVLHPGVDASVFVPAARDDAARARLGWAGRRVVLTVGALQKRKGQDMMIRALPAIAQRCPDVLYVVAGAGADESSLRTLAKELDVESRVQFRGPIADHDLIESYQQCDLFALPNRQVGWDFEGFGIVLIEAQACGIPVIAGRSGGTGETMSPGVSGEIVACETPEPIAEVVTKLLDDPERRARMGRAGREWVSARYDWPVLTRQATALFTGRD